MGNKRDHTSVMDLLTSLYSDFVMNDREVVFHSIAGRSSGGVCWCPRRQTSVDERGDVFSPHRRGAVGVGRGRSVEVGLTEDRRAVTPPGV